MEGEVGGGVSKTIIMVFFIIAIQGPAHAKKLRMIGALMWHLQEQYGAQRTYLDPDDPLRSSVIYTFNHYNIGFVLQGTDPRHPEVDPLRELVRRRCFVILYPLSAKHGSKEQLNAFAASHEYTTVYFEPMAPGHLPQMWPRQDLDELRKRILSANSEALRQLATGLIGMGKNMVQLEQERSRRAMRKIYA